MPCYKIGRCLNKLSVPPIGSSLFDLIIFQSRSQGRGKRLEAAN